MPTVFFCDDDRAVLYTLQEAMRDTGATVKTFSSAKAAMDHLGDADVLVTDLVMPEMDGMALLAHARSVDPELPVVLLTAQGSERAAVAAMKQGAYDYLTKPFAIDELRAVVARAAEARALRRTSKLHGIERSLGRAVVGESAAWRKLVTSTERVGRRDVHVVVRGETGTGKELIASMLHAASPRRDRPLVRFNCAALPLDLAESELFGHVRGAFTGAIADRRGFFMQANGGTLVLDEIGELPLALQAKLLRAVQEGEIQPLGAERVERVDVRVVACTHRDLAAECGAGRFRQDLYFRLAVVELVVPPLRDRREDVRPLALTFARRFADKFDLDDLRLSDDLLAALEGREWPGNVRELENVIARLAALSEGGTLDAAALEDRAAAPPSPALGTALRVQVAAFERSVVERALADAGGNQSEAARKLSISRMTLIEKMKRYGIRGR